MNSSFGFFIKNFRMKKGLLSFRNFYKILVSNGLKMDITEYSKIERGIQNPRNKQEFEIIIQSLGITDQKIIAELEKKQLAKQCFQKINSYTQVLYLTRLKMIKN